MTPTPTIPTPKEYIDSLLSEDDKHAQVSVTLTGTPAQIHRGLKHMAHTKKGGKAFKATGGETKDLEPDKGKGEKEEESERIETKKEESSKSFISKIIGG
jgi:hypothetical protein